MRAPLSAPQYTAKMTNGIRVKICGLTTRQDAEAAHACGADFLGFIQYPKSPRYISMEAFRGMLPDLPPIPKIGVVVYSSMSDLEALKESPFDFIQLHFPNETPFFEAALWTDIIPPERLWMAPRILPMTDLDLAFLPLADTFLMDTFDAEKVGGSGRTGDWEKFRRLREKHQKINWVLAGGLTPENVADAVTTANTRNIDVNSGVESAPGVKDHSRIKALFEKLATLPPQAT